MRTIALVYLLPFLVAGCFFGDAVVHKTVSLNLRPREDQSKATLSIDDPQVQEAMKLIDATLGANGFARDPNPIAAEDQARGLIAFYGICGVTLNSNKLDIGFLESHQRHFSAHTRKTIDQLKNNLSSRFGRQNVRIED